MSFAPTEKLYWDDPRRESSSAESGHVASFGGRASVVVDATVFFPESGGQLGDRGWLESGGRRVAVVDTQIDQHGVIHHLLAEALSDGVAVVPSVRLSIDAERRATQREQHTAQHMLSCALADVANGPTVSARLGETSSTIDVGLDRVEESLLARAEDLVNAIIRDDLLVRAFFPTPIELAALPLRRAPKVAENVRVVAVGEGGATFDVTPCGGTHVGRTGQIGAVRITGVERYKGMTRVTFLAGARAVEDARTKDRVLSRLARELSCGPLDVPSALAKLHRDLRAEREHVTKLRAELAALDAERLLAEHAPRRPHTAIVAFVDDADPARARNLAVNLAARQDVLALVVSAPRSTEPTPPASADGAEQSFHVILVRGASVTADCGAVFKALAAAHGGKGGGSPGRAEGRLPRTVPREALVNALGVAEA